MPDVVSAAQPGESAAGPGGDAIPAPADVAVWRAFLRAHSRVLRKLESELVDQGEIPLATYDVLVQLTEAPDHRLRMTELADRVLLSRSGLTRLIDRLERDGLVRREPCSDDARGMYAVLTSLGVDRLRSASHVHLPGVSAHFVQRFTRQELARLGQLLGRLAD
jgi:DNA-binding MarR family transcriptional regulator